MEKVDLVIVGAEGVVENGGIINKVGASVLHRSLLRARSSTDDFGHPTTLLWFIPLTLLILKTPPLQPVVSHFP